MRRDVRLRVSAPVWMGRALIALLMGFTTGCLKTSSEVPEVDAQPTDAQPMEAGGPDMDAPDADRPDLGLPDLGLPDLGRPDAEPDAACVPVEERCNDADDDCDGRVDEAFVSLGTPCFVGQGLCRIDSEWSCNAEQDDIECPVEPDPPAEERCDALDNDCDGRADEDFPEVGDACEVGIGACVQPGVLTCSEAGGVMCVGEPGDPGEELCNTIDDDCDGTTDEGFVDLGAPCASGLGACERSGFLTCGPEGVPLVCDAAPGLPSPERCDGVDDDCDGTVDEAAGEVGNPCETDEPGRCMAGRIVCTMGAPVCMADLEAIEETCNGEDDDCDGAVDENNPGGGGPCLAERPGICAEGVETCVEGAPRCVSRQMPAEERCDTIDNDCDGNTDEAFANLGEGCANGVGACRRGGVLTCTPDGGDVFCAGPAPGRPVAERCGDNLDNDCDGATDEGFPQIGRPCDVGQGLCARQGVSLCEAGAVACSAAPGQPVPELCNGEDDDCDGAIDEAPAPEVCDELDNDCDGRIDEDFRDLGEICAQGVGLCRREGVFECGPGGELRCPAQPGAAVAEVCDGADNDCDGNVDENFGVGQPCERGLGLCAAQGRQICAEDGLRSVCDAQLLPPQPEICDREDNDCDGLFDEGFPDPDGDQLCSDVDNCPEIANPDQADFEGDGIGDVCDPDDDGDGAPDETDVCPGLADPEQGDIDRDGVGDACDFDQDGDGIVETGFAQPLISPRAAPGGQYGTAVAFLGDQLFVGAPAEPTENSPLGGRVHILEVAADGLWAPAGQLIPLPAEPGLIAGFGTSVSGQGDRVVVGAPGERVGDLEFAGTAYVFVRDGAAWRYEARLVPDPHTGIADQAGFVVEIDGDRIAMGVPGANIEGRRDAGEVIIFERGAQGWRQTARLRAPQPRARAAFGTDVLLSGDELVVGEPGLENDPERPAGEAYVYRRGGDGVWQAVQVLSFQPEAGDAFGVSLSQSGDRLFVGSTRRRVDNVPVGQAFGFERANVGAPWVPWVITIPGTAQAEQRYGIVAISGGLVAVGAWRAGPLEEGAFYFYIVNLGGELEFAGIFADPAAPPFAFLAFHIAIGDLWLAAGAPGLIIDEFNPGQVYVFPLLEDNCPTVPNPGQFDADGDGVGDACEP